MDPIFSEDDLIQSSDYAQVMSSVVIPWLESKQQVTTVSGFGDVPLYCVSYVADQPLGTVFIVHGFTENAYKYAELIWSLLHQHFSVVIYDQRGHGRSWRSEGIPDASVTHVDHFSDYVNDLDRICEFFRSRMTGPFFLFAHSMGGAVASLFLESHPDFFSAAVLSSPMIAPNLRGVPAPLASVLGSIAGIFGKKKHKPFFMKTYAGPEDFSTSCASDPVRFAWYDAVKASRREFQNSVPSYQWSLESMNVTKKILAPGEPEKISCPLLLFTAETDDSVLPGPQKALIQRIPNGKQTLVRNARHEIFRSTNDVLFPWWKEVLTFYRIHCGKTCTEGGVKV